MIPVEKSTYKRPTGEKSANILPKVDVRACMRMGKRSPNTNHAGKPLLRPDLDVSFHDSPTTSGIEAIVDHADR
jgi:hypothetical protein